MVTGILPSKTCSCINIIVHKYWPNPTPKPYPTHHLGKFWFNNKIVEAPNYGSKAKIDISC